ncbi:MAG TPA: hypothetical protein PK275_00235 [Chitinophagaceae bacterium]|nr:hypothetical protein [Chitinophagaceae bacterium]
MANKTRKYLQQEYNLIKNLLKKAIRPQKKEVLPQLVLQPLRNQR